MRRRTGQLGLMPPADDGWFDDGYLGDGIGVIRGGRGIDPTGGSDVIGGGVYIGPPVPRINPPVLGTGNGTQTGSGTQTGTTTTVPTGSQVPGTMTILQQPLAPGQVSTGTAVMVGLGILGAALVLLSGSKKS
jgi:hypothetical protein